MYRIDPTGRYIEMNARQSGSKTDLLLYNALVLTMRDTRDIADAVLVRDDRIVAAGALLEVEPSVGKNAVRVDLQGRTLLPGFNDNHIHATGVGNMQAMPDLYGMSKAEILSELAERFANGSAIRTRGWVVATNWDYSTCPDPHRSDLDKLFPETPVMLFQYSGHAAWCNSRALAQLKITARTPNWPKGEVIKDECGEPTGVLREPHIFKAVRKRWIAAAGLWSSKPAYNALRTAMSKLNEAGITSVQDNTWFPSTVNAIKRLYDNNELSVRFSCWVRPQYRMSAFLIDHRPFDNVCVKRGPAKFFFDGAFSTRSAWLQEAYADEADNFGKGIDEAEIVKLIEPFVLKKRQVAAHAIGDRAVHEYVNAIENISRRNPDVVHQRPRIEHGQLIDPDDIPRIRDLGMYVAAQPSAIVDIEKDTQLLGPERAARAYPYRSLLDVGVPLSFGSDCPGEHSFQPLLGIQNAVERAGSEAIEVFEALRCYTIESARAEGSDRQKGTIEAGKLADMVVLEANPLTAPVSSIRNIGIYATMVGGRWVYGPKSD